MALDPRSSRRSASPASSDGSSAFTSRARAKDQEGLLKKDKSYRRYAAGVERALSLFDNALQEWADYISFLSRLLKALQAHPPHLTIIPSKILISKRLAQCMNPTLPSGVHQKTLEVYSYIFSLLKPEGLSHDLQLYLPGISSTLTFASLSVRPLFLSLVQSYLLGLEQWAVRPALRSIILMLLPGLEEETSEDFDRVLHILDRFKAASGQVGLGSIREEGSDQTQYFWQCLFLASITNPSRRLGVLAYLNRYLPHLGGSLPKITDALNGNAKSTGHSTPATAVVSPEPGLLVRCFAAGLSDEQILIQRNFLDLLVTHFPLHSPVFQTDVPEGDKELLVTAAVGVVIRRDMSLNRRLWTWFLGPENFNEQVSGRQPDSPSHSTSTADAALTSPNVDEYGRSQYFNRYGLNPLVQSLKTMISKDPQIPSERARPFRIALSLMDRWEVGGHVVPEVFLPIMKSVRQYEETTKSRDEFVEVLRSANVFFDGVESGLIWSEILDLVSFPSDLSSSVPEVVLANIDLARFIVTNFNVREEEMLVIHVPLVALALLSMTSGLDYKRLDDDESLSAALHVSSKALGFALDLVSLISERAFHISSSADKDQTDMQRQHSSKAAEDNVDHVRKFYIQTRNNPEFANLPFSGAQIGSMLLKEASALISSEIVKDEPSSSLNQRVLIFTTLLSKVPSTDAVVYGRLFGAIQRKLALDQEHIPSIAPFSAVSSIISVVMAMYHANPTNRYITYDQLADICPLLVRYLWSHLSPSDPNYHVESTRCLWQLQSLMWHDQIVEAAIAILMIEGQIKCKFHLINPRSAERFAVLWNHSSQGNLDFSDGIRLSLLPSSARNKDPEVGKIEFSSMLQRPVFLMLDLLSHETSDAYPIAKSWVQSAPQFTRVFKIVLSRLYRLRSWTYVPNDDEYAADGFDEMASNDIEQCQYFIHTLFHVLNVLPDEEWGALTTDFVPLLPKPLPPQVESEPFMVTLQQALLHLCHRVVEMQELWSKVDSSSNLSLLLRTTLSVLQQLLSGPYSDRLAESRPEDFLIERLLSADGSDDSHVQEALIDALLASLKLFTKLHPIQKTTSTTKHRRTSSRDTVAGSARLSVSTEKTEKDQNSSQQTLPPPKLFECLIHGLSSSSRRPVLDKWITVLMESFPLYSSTIFQIMLPLVECFVKEIKASFNELQTKFRDRNAASRNGVDRALVSLLNGSEFVLAKAHDRLMIDEMRTPSVRSPEQAPGFFGNMVSGVFATEGNQARSATANNRLTVLLCFQDAVRICFSIWSWGNGARDSDLHDVDSLASFQYTSLRMRNKTRRMLEHVFGAEALECLETLIELWTKSQNSTGSSVLDLLHTLDASRPKIATPAIFNAIYSRTNPTALDPIRKSTLTSDLSESDLVNFLVVYAKSLEDDVLEEIWTDCTMFLRDVLANPFPHRQILPRLMEFTAILGEKMENTNFGEERRMRRELGDLFVRLLTAIFTIKPAGLSSELSMTAPLEKSQRNRSYSQRSLESQTLLGPDDVVSVLARTMPIFSTALGDSDRIATTVNNISTNVIGPLFHARLFPDNLKSNSMNLLHQISKVPSASKIWRKDIAEAFNDQRFFRCSIDLVQHYWLGLLRHWALVEKDRLSDLYSRLTPPTTAGIMFGVGATAARLEADRKTQTNLRRIAVMILACENDTFVANLSGLLERMEDLVSATAISSPSSATRAEVFMVFRALVLKTSAIHLAPFWPIINSELQEAISAVFPDDREEAYNAWSILQGCKLLDVLLLVAPDEFQLHEWLFVTDTIDAVYRPNNWEPVSLVDEMSQNLGQKHIAPSTPHLQSSLEANKEKRRPWLSSNDTRTVPKDQIVGRVLRPFFDQLSIHMFEGTYSMGVSDREACVMDLLADLFHEETIAGS